MNPSLSLLFRGAPVTSLIVATNAAVFLAQLVHYYLFNSLWIDDTFALSPNGIAAGHWWQFLTYGWLHSVTLVIHILFNMLMVWFLGHQLEKPLGSSRFSILYLGAVLAGGGTWFLMNHNPEAGIEGASGAVYGLVAAFGCYDPKREIRALLFFVIPIRTRAGTFAIVLVAVEVLCQWQGWLPFISHTAHLGGAAFGFLVMKLWGARRPPPPEVVFYDSVSTPIE